MAIQPQIAPAQQEEGTLAKWIRLLTGSVAGLAALVGALAALFEKLRAVLPTVVGLASPTTLFASACGLAFLAAYLILRVQREPGRLVYHHLRDWLRSHEPIPQLIGAAVLIAGLVTGGAVAFQVSHNIDTVIALTRINSTKYVGTFPGNMTAINKLLDSQHVKQEVRILVDFPAYGSYSDPIANQEYQSTLERLASSGKKVTLLIYGKDQAEKATREQFIGEDFTKIQSTRAFQCYFDDFHRTIQKPKSLDEFGEALMKVNEDVLQHLSGRNGITIKQVKREIPIFMWLVDDDCAIFSFYNLKGGKPEDATEVSFMTSDRNLVAILRRIFETYDR